MFERLRALLIHVADGLLFLQRSKGRGSAPGMSERITSNLVGGKRGKFESLRTLFFILLALRPAGAGAGEWRYDS